VERGFRDVLPEGALTKRGEISALILGRGLAHEKKKQKYLAVGVVSTQP